LKGKRLEGNEDARAMYLKWPKAKHGHYIIYRPMNDGIFVLRILHGTMDIPRHL